MSREFHKFFWAFNCCCYKTHGFHKISTFRENNFAFSRNVRITHFRLNHFSEKNMKISWKKLRNETENFRFFSRNAKRFVRWKPTIHAQMAMSDLQRYPKKIFVKYEIIINFFFLLFILHEGFSGKMTCTFLACKEQWKNDVIFNIFIRLIFQGHLCKSGIAILAWRVHTN